MKDLVDDALATVDRDLDLVAFEGTDDAGNPRLLIGPGREVLFVVGRPDALTSGFAVVRVFDGDRLAVLGYLGRTAVQAAAGLTHAGDWLELRHGKAAVRLNRDGRLRLEGTDIRVETHGTFAISAAEIALN